MLALQFQSVSKRYRIRSGAETSRRGLLGKLRGLAAQKEDFWAVRNVDFEVKEGESLGIIGHNGAGKSTVLKLLSNITTPTQGKITIHGRISALLEVGSGFHPELTGRENIYLSGSILGMRRNEITSKLDSIIDFAGVRQFIDSPVKRYSSGMFVRLGFSIAAHLNPDILLLDEVLAVGDQNFQDRCKERILEMHRQGTTMVFISHDLNAVKAICGRVLLMHRGQVIAEGSPEKVIARYMETGNFHGAPQFTGHERVAEITGVAFRDANGRTCANFATGYPICLRVNYRTHRAIPDGAISLFFVAMDGTVAAQWTTGLDGHQLDMLPGDSGVEFSCEEFGLQPGIYSIDACVERAGTDDTIEWQRGCTSIHVEAGRKIRGQFYMPHEWRQVEATIVPIGVAPIEVDLAFNQLALMEESALNEPAKVP